MSEELPSQAQVVIIGGGIIGCSLAYHFTKLGWRDVVLLERKQLTCGTTWHAAGLVGQLRATANLTRLAQYTANLYATLEEETGQATGFKQNGSLSIATNGERFEELKRGASMARTFGLEVEVIGNDTLKRMWPLIEVSDVVGAVFLPKDGQTNPVDTTMALARGAKAGGARIIEDARVTGIQTRQTGRQWTGSVSELINEPVGFAAGRPDNKRPAPERMTRYCGPPRLQAARTHLALDKQCPRTRRIEKQERGKIIAFPHVGGLNHEYRRVASQFGNITPPATNLGWLYQPALRSRAGSPYRF